MKSFNIKQCCSFPPCICWWSNDDFFPGGEDQQNTLVLHWETPK